MMQDAICHIVCAGPGNLSLSADEIGTEDYLVACDVGYLKCINAQISPDLLIGDFDSLSSGKPQNLKCECIELPTEKDDTDLLAAIKVCLERGFKNYRIYTALGGDLGHTIAAINALFWLRNQGPVASIEGCGQNVLIVLPKDGKLSLAEILGKGFLTRGTRLSVFAYGGDATGVCEYDMYYELKDATLSASDSLGVSNYVQGDNPAVSVSSGALLVIVG